MNLPVSWQYKSFTYQELSQAGADLLVTITKDKHHVARRILCIACSIDKIKLIAHAHSLVSQEDVDKYYDYLVRFINHEPLSRLEGLKNFIALFAACVKAAKQGRIKTMPITKQVAAVSCGIYKGNAVLDLDYIEDSQAQADANFILTDTGQIIEIQATAETEPFSENLFQDVFALARKGIKELSTVQAKLITEIMA